ncbi:MAG TPA: hypothetical protein VHT75_07265 [Acidimicrobiales bacterium]|nr:hypothetical protein [Acidimicrobiales bacterium]
MTFAVAPIAAGEGDGAVAFGEPVAAADLVAALPGEQAATPSPAAAPNAARRRPVILDVGFGETPA